MRSIHSNFSLNRKLFVVGGFISIHWGEQLIHWEKSFGNQSVMLWKGIPSDVENP